MVGGIGASCDVFVLLPLLARCSEAGISRLLTQSLTRLTKWIFLNSREGEGSAKAVLLASIAGRPSHAATALTPLVRQVFTPSSRQAARSTDNPRTHWSVWKEN